MFWFLLLLIGIMALAVIAGTVAAGVSRAARAKRLDTQRDVHGNIRAR